MRQRLLKRGQRQLKSQAEYLLQHMGLSEHQVQAWKNTAGDRLSQSASLPQLSARSRTSSRSSGEPGVQDPVMAYIMNGPPSYSPTLAGMASAALP